MLMLLKTLATGQTQRHPSTLNGGFPPWSRNWWSQKHHERAEAGSVTLFSHKAPTSRTVESPAPCRNPHCLPGGCKGCRGLKERNPCTCLGFWQKGSVQEHFRQEADTPWWSHSQFSGANLGCLWRAATAVPQDKWCPKSHRYRSILARQSSLQVSLISMPAFLLKSFYFKYMWCLCWQSPVSSPQRAQVLSLPLRLLLISLHYSQFSLLLPWSSCCVLWTHVKPWFLKKFMGGLESDIFRYQLS